jgi:general secretion pathway protein B
MSYILEALKKLEQKREQEEPPRLFIFSRGPRPERKRRLSWPYLLAAALLLNALAMIWWVSERQAEKGKTVAENAAVPLESVPPAPLTAPEGRHYPPAGAQGVMAHAPAKPVEAPPPATAAPEVPRVRAPKAGQTERPQAQPESREEKGKRSHGLVLRLNELPSAVRGTLPEFKISGHAYSPEPQTRVARINEKILQEGQELAPGLTLEEITPGGVIFGCRGYRFRVDLSESR